MNFNNKFTFFKDEKSKLEKITGDILLSSKKYKEACENMYRLTGSDDVWRCFEALSEVVYMLIDGENEREERNKRNSL